MHVAVDWGRNPKSTAENDFGSKLAYYDRRVAI